MTNRLELYIRHQGGSSALMVVHLSPEQRLQLIRALADEQPFELPAVLELSPQSQWATEPEGARALKDAPHVVIPLQRIHFQVHTDR